MSEAAGKIYRSRGQVIAFLVGLVVFDFIAVSAAVARGAPYSILYGVIAIGLSVAMLRGMVTRLEARSTGIRVVNYFSSFVVGWKEIERFEIGRSGNLGAVLLIKLRNGETRHAFGIQELRLEVVRRRYPAQAVADELNRELALRTGRDVVGWPQPSGDQSALPRSREG